MPGTKPVLSVLSAIKSYFTASLHPTSEARVTIVALLVEERDCELLVDVCHRHRWDVRFAGTCADASDAANRLKAPLVFCDRDLPGTDWRDLVHVLAAPPHNACVVLVSRVTDAYLWDEVVHKGGYDLLSKPLQEVDVVRVVKLGWSYWNTTRGRRENAG